MLPSANTSANRAKGIPSLFHGPGDTYTLPIGLVALGESSQTRRTERYARLDVVCERDELFPIFRRTFEPLSSRPRRAALGTIGGGRRGRAVAVLALGLVVGCGGPSATLEEARGRSFVLLGLDGATWNVLDPLLEAGDMPTLAGLLARGARAELHAESKYVRSGPSWTTIASGKRVEHHGIVGNEGDPEVARFWDVLGSQGLPSLVIGWILTDAARPLEGWMISGPFAETRSQPPGLLAELEPELGPYVADADLREASRPFVDSATESSRSQMRYLRELLPRRPWSVAAAVVVAPDRLQHFFWKYHEPEHFGLDPASPEVRAFGEVIRGWWRDFDGELARLLERIDLERTTLVLLSDHGFEAARGLGPRCKHLSIPYLLREAGWLELDRDHRVVPERTRVRGEAERADRLPEASRTLRLWVDDPSLLEPVRAFFAGAETGQGERCFDDVRVEDGEVHLKVLRAPELRIDDVMLLPVEDEVRRVPLVSLVTRERSRSGAHHPRGILVAAGPGVRRGVTLDEIDGDQVTPTLLAALGLPLARDMDGEPARELFVRGWLPETPPPVASWDPVVPARQSPVGDTEALQDRLRGLGYLE